jgi:SAM-dependent methyltransferase
LEVGEWLWLLLQNVSKGRALFRKKQKYVLSNSYYSAKVTVTKLPLCPGSLNKRHKNMEKAWFESWFDSSYYHRLYVQRDENEAEAFLFNLLKYLQPQPKDRCLDLACGKGRHAIYLAEQGLDVIGLDLSIESIEQARASENDQLRFYSHDMRQPFHTNYFKYVFNLFTSFGYFESAREHITALQNVNRSLQPGGTFILDFFNAKLVQQSVEPRTVIERGGTQFTYLKKVENNRIIKTIRFTDDEGRRRVYQEKVHLFDLTMLQNMVQKAGFGVERVFGDYNLSAFDEQTSVRCILVMKKI